MGPSVISDESVLRFIYVRARSKAKATSLQIDSSSIQFSAYIKERQRSKEKFVFAFPLIKGTLSVLMLMYKVIKKQNLQL